MNRCVILVVFVLLVVLTAKGGEVPDKLDIVVGGFDGPSYGVLLANGVLHYRTSESMSQLQDPKTKPVALTPTDAQWKAEANGVTSSLFTIELSALCSVNRDCRMSRPNCEK